MKFLSVPILVGLFAHSYSLFGSVYNLKVVTDASPDYSDMDSMVRSVASNWETTEEKCWAMFYWNHIARRQTAPMMLHGMALTDPIRQFNDYGYTMCSTISGINCAIWDAMGLKSKYWDISNHTVPEVEYNGAWHMYDNSMTALYTLCDGKTLAPVDQIGKTLACAASEGRAEPGHIAKYHCLMATSARGFLTGADTVRGLDEEYRCFNPNGLKYRSYFYDWDRGHRYVLNLRDGESYTRFYHSLGTGPEFFVPNQGKDPEGANPRYHVRGNGVWKWRPKVASSFKINGANVITALRMRGRASEPTAILVSTSNGGKWKEVAKAKGEFDVRVVDEVNGAYEVLVRAEAGVLGNMEFETTTMLNSKTQPKLNLGKNTIHVGAGDQTESIVIWPDLQGDHYKPFVIEEKNIATARAHPGYMGVMHAKKGNAPAYVVFKVDAPRPITSVNYGGRFYNRATGSRIELFHSFDQGRTWMRSYSLTNTHEPWDVIHYEMVKDAPTGTSSVLFKYLLESPEAGAVACSLYAVRMEVNHKAIEEPFKPMQVTFHWDERQEDYSVVKRSHTETIAKLPYRYSINVGGVDHPTVESLEINSAATAKNGYSDAKDMGGEKFVPRWVSYGKNLALGKAYTVSIPSNTNWGAGDPEGKKLTDGIVGPPYPGGVAPMFALGWDKGKDADITLDLGAAQNAGRFGFRLGLVTRGGMRSRGSLKTKRKFSFRLMDKILRVRAF